MPQTHTIRRILTRFFPRKAAISALAPLSDLQQWEHLPSLQKKELAEHFLAAGELALLKDDLSALAHFEAAVTLASDHPDVWYREGLSFFDYGLKEGKEKALLLSSRYFKLAAQLAPERCEIWTAWGSTLLQLGIAYNEHHFYLEAKEKFQRAISCSDHILPVAQARLYWDYGLVWAELAQHSGEAVDIRLAIQAFRISMDSHENPPPEFLNDCGNAYLQMGLLINDSRLYLQAVDVLCQAIDADEHYVDGWVSLANAYSQLYINSMEERFAQQANDCYERLSHVIPENADNWLGWAQLLGESGKLNRDVRKLRQSIEKSARGYALDPDHPLLLCQWVESLSFLGMQTGRLDLLIEAENKILRATDQFPDDPDLWHAYGICLIAFGQYYSDPDYYEYAIEKLQHGLSLDRTHAEIWHALALAHSYVANLTDDLDMIERSTRFFSRALDLKPACPSLIFDAANAWLLSCDLHDDAKDLESAISLYETLLQGQKESLINHPEWLFQYATALEWLGEFTTDESYFTKAVDLYLHVLLIDPETPKIYFRIAMCLVRLGEFSLEADYYKRALYYFRFAVRQDEEDEAVWLEWGTASIHLAHHSLDGDTMDQCYADAEQKLIRAGQLGNLNANYNLACLYSILGRYEEAMEFIRKAEKANALPTVEEMCEDEWLDNLHHTEMFAQFLSNLETKHGNGTTEF